MKWDEALHCNQWSTRLLRNVYVVQRLSHVMLGNVDIRSTGICLIYKLWHASCYSRHELECSVLFLDWQAKARIIKAFGMLQWVTCYHGCTKRYLPNKTGFTELYERFRVLISTRNLLTKLQIYFYIIGAIDADTGRSIIAGRVTKSFHGLKTFDTSQANIDCDITTWSWDVQPA